jgi:hypothetical protein
MACPVIIRNNYGHLSYLVLDDHPRELLRHPGFQEEYSLRSWLGSTDPTDAREEWSEMLDEDISFYIITDEDNWEYCHDRGQWDHCLQK